MEVKKIFTDIYTNNKWSCSESKSGPGSRISVNKNLLKLLEQFTEEHKIRSIIDCGCGDFNWMKLFDYNLIDSYTGIDIVENMISDNNQKYKNDKINFQSLSIISDKIPSCDLVICKDVLFHLSYDDAKKTLQNIKESKSKFLLSTTFTDFKNFDIKTGGWRPINLESEPFNLGKPFLKWSNIEQRKDKFSNKSIGIWKLNN